MNLHWFRSDLRIHDNPALYTACNNGFCVSIYCLAQKQWDEHDLSAAQRSLIVRQLRDLQQQLERLNIPLIVLPVENFKNLPAALLKFCHQHNIEALYYNHEYPVNEQRCAREVDNNFSSDGIAVHSFHDQCLIMPGEIRNQHGEMYKVYTAFSRAWLQALRYKRRQQYETPAKQDALKIRSDIKALDLVKLEPRWAKLWPAGEEAAHRRLRDFIEYQIEDYAKTRDFPSIDGTSTLSPWLAVGALSSTQCLDTVASHYEDALEFKAKSGAAIWINEIIWREFYRHLLVAFPRLSMHRAFQAKTEALPWRYDEKLFQSWCKGKTGYPLVDAAMQQLHSWGWMHNRLRMVVAMFLTKHLFIDWRWGEKYFMQHLVDGDLASNNGGWQWSASTGVDAQPWFRIFNPTRQSQRFDPEGKFIRAWLPQLKDLDNKAIHQPSPLEAKNRNYPRPIVDHREATTTTKSAFENL